MKKTSQLVCIGLLGLLALAACNSKGKPALQTVVYSTSPPSATEVSTLPTPIPQGQVIIYKDLQVVMNQAEITTGYETEYGSRREPALGGKFLWIDVQFENIGSREQALPAPEHFSVVYDTSEFKSSYGHRKGYSDYTVLKPNLFPGQKVDAWLRFDIPTAAQLQELKFAFLPESVQVSFSSSSTAYSWADHPEFFWKCGQ